MRTIRYVSNDKEGRYPDDYHSIQAAIKSVPVDNHDPVTIFIRKGTYCEKLVIDRPYICFEGEDMNETIITYQDYALMMMEDGTRRGIFRTPTVFVNTHDFTAKNLTIMNSAGCGRQVGQAIALYADGDRLLFDHVKILASQNTVFIAPLPPTPYIPGAFVGPKEFAPRINGRQYYRNCFIQGDVDFIFGSGTTLFENCELYTKKSDDLPPALLVEDQKVYGYVAAASTPKGQNYGFVFLNCRLTSDCPKESVYLGRPWRNYAQTVFLNCELGPHIKREGWQDWGKTEAHDSIFFAEYQNTGEGAVYDHKKRAAFSRQLSLEEANSYTKEHILNGSDYWISSLTALH